MSLPIEDLTPRQIVTELDRYIVGQDAAKRAVAVALRNRYRRQQLSEDERDDVLPKNILMMGPTGVGKTEIARRLAQLAKAPFIKVEATKFTEVGYVGRDVESMIRDLVSAAVRLVERERVEVAREKIEATVEERLIDLIEENRSPRQSFHTFFDDPETNEPEETEDKRLEKRAQIRVELLSGALDHEVVEVDVEESAQPFVQVFSNQGIEEMGIDGPFGNNTRRTTRRVSVRDARGVIFGEESKAAMDKGSLYAEAIHRTEQTGIIFLDEIDKVAGKQGGSGPDVSREGVQRDLLPIIEGSTVATKYGAVRTDHILFIAAGAFHMSRPSDLIPELQGRLPIRVTLDSLKEGDFRRILSEPKNSLTRQYQLLLATDGVTLNFDQGALDSIANAAILVNEKIENIGARRLHTILEKLLEDILFEAPEERARSLTITADFVRTKLGDDPTRSIL